MNGQDMLEAMSFVDEKYIEDAETAPKIRRLHWQPIAAMAACFCLVLYGYRTLTAPMLDKVAQQESQDISFAAIAPAAEVPNNDVVMGLDEAMEYAPKTMSTAMMRITVRVDAVEDGTLLCTVTDPGTTVWENGIQKRILPPEGSEPPVVGSTYALTFRPTEDDIIRAVEMTLTTEES